MAKFDKLGDRMKRYEQASSHVLPPRMPVIIRVDGRAFHTYTRKCPRPWDPQLATIMVRTASCLCEEIQGAELAYVQSDEISILVHGYKKFESQPWFDNKVQKIVSVAAGIASSSFTYEICKKQITTVELAVSGPAVFDARVFVLPEADVCNYFVWRQKDAIRNSIQSLARSLFSQKKCHKKSSVDLLDMCTKEGVDWAELTLHQQRGACVTKKRIYSTGYPRVTLQSSWDADFKIPVFSEDRTYLSHHLTVEDG